MGYEALIYAVENASALIRPPGNVFYQELEPKQKTVQQFLPAFLRVIDYESNQAGKPLNDDPPMGVVRKSWKRYVVIKDWGGLIKSSICSTILMMNLTAVVHWCSSIPEGRLYPSMMT